MLSVKLRPARIVLFTLTDSAEKASARCKKSAKWESERAMAYRVLDAELDEEEAWETPNFQAQAEPMISLIPE